MIRRPPRSPLVPYPTLFRSAVPLGRATAAATGLALASERRRRRRGLGLWFMLRLTVAEHGAARILPGGGSAAAAVTYSALRTRGLKPARVAVAVATISVLVYGALDRKSVV